MKIACLVERSKWWRTKEPVVFKGLTELNVSLISFSKLVYNVLSEDSGILSISGSFVSGLRSSGSWHRITADWCLTFWDSVVGCLWRWPYHVVSNLRAPLTHWHVATYAWSPLLREPAETCIVSLQPLYRSTSGQHAMLLPCWLNLFFLPLRSPVLWQSQFAFLFEMFVCCQNRMSWGLSSSFWHPFEGSSTQKLLHM